MNYKIYLFFTYIFIKNFKIHLLLQLSKLMQKYFNKLKLKKNVEDEIGIENQIANKNSSYNKNQLMNLL